MKKQDKILILSLLAVAVVFFLGYRLWNLESPAAFNALAFVTELRTTYPRIIFGLPFGGLLIVWMYRWERSYRFHLPWQQPVT